MQQRTVLINAGIQHLSIQSCIEAPQHMVNIPMRLRGQLKIFRLHPAGHPPSEA
jgi:hypothetical protein